MKKIVLIILYCSVIAPLQDEEMDRSSKPSGLCLNNWWNNLAFTKSAQERVAVNNCFKKIYTSYLGGLFCLETVTDDMFALQRNDDLSHKKDDNHLKQLLNNTSDEELLTQIESFEGPLAASSEEFFNWIKNRKSKKCIDFAQLNTNIQRNNPIKQPKDYSPPPGLSDYSIFIEVEADSNEEFDTDATTASTSTSSASSSRSSSPAVIAVVAAVRQQFNDIAREHNIDPSQLIQEIKDLLNRNFFSQEAHIKEIQIIKGKCLRALKDERIKSATREELGKLHANLFLKEKELRNDLRNEERKKLQALNMQYRNDEKLLLNSNFSQKIASHPAIKAYLDSLSDLKLKKFGPDIINKGDMVLHDVLQNKIPTNNDKSREHYLDNILCLMWRFYAHALVKRQGFTEGTFYLPPTAKSEKIFKYLHGYVELVKNEKIPGISAWVPGLSGNPYAYERISSHYKDSEVKQYGIDICFKIDNGAEPLLPEGKAHILFGKNFIKIENHGLSNLHDSVGHGLEFLIAQGRKIAPAYFGSDDQDDYRKERVPHKALSHFKSLLVAIELPEKEAAGYYDDAKQHGIKDMYRIANALKIENKNDQHAASKIDAFLDFIINTYGIKYIEQRTGNEVMLGDSLFTPSSSSQQ